MGEIYDREHRDLMMGDRISVKGRLVDDSQIATGRARGPTITYAALAIGLISLFGITIASQPAWCHDEVRLGRMLIGYDIADLPVDPTPQQQIEAGPKQIAVVRENDPGLDSNAEVHGYFNEIASKLLAASYQKPIFPIEVYVS